MKFYELYFSNNLREAALCSGCAAGYIHYSVRPQVLTAFIKLNVLDIKDRNYYFYVKKNTLSGVLPLEEIR